MVDTDLETRLLVDLERNLEIVIEDVGGAIADVTRCRVEVGRLAEPLRRPGRADAVLFGGHHTIAAPLRITAVAAADEAVEIDRCAAREGQDDIFVEVGQVEVERDVHAAAVVIVDEAEIEAIHLLAPGIDRLRSEEHTSELQSLMRISYAVFCLKTKK